ncbi:MAG: VWA domain-containing protein [bacterium]|nr:VWA domain-containing protein [bacterium]
MRLALLLALLVPAPGLAQDGEAQEGEAQEGEAQEGEAQRLLAIVRERGDDTPDKVFESLGKLGDQRALAALERAARHVSTPWSLQRVYEAFRHFEEPLRAEAVVFLAGVAEDGERLHKIGAVRGLVAIGGAAKRNLAEVAAESEVDTCRQIAVGALLSELRVRRRPADLELILAHYRYPISGPRTACVRALRAFDNAACLAVFRAALLDSELASQTRTMIIDALEEMPGEAVDELLVRALEIEAKAKVDVDVDAVRLAAIEALGERGYRGHVLALERLERQGSDAVARAAFVAQSSARADDERWLRRMLRTARSKEPQWRSAAATVLARSSAPRAHETLFELASDEASSVRSSAIAGLAGLRTKSSVGALVERMQAEEGYLRGAARQVLVRLTGVDHGLSPARWRDWWDSEGAGFVLPTRAEALAAHLERERVRGGRTTKSTTFFGVTIEETAVCFVLDVSSSMAERSAGGATRLELVERELARSLERYATGDLFNLILFESSARVWRDRLVPMTEDERVRALRHVARQNPRGETALYDGLVAALEDPRVESLVVLSDGAPTAGSVREPERIVKDVLGRASKRGVRIHCVSIARESALLAQLARGTGGDYHSVE